ncbi:MAG: hypothetical protein ACPGSO_02095 [Vicingaceae bacterium]
MLEGKGYFIDKESNRFKIYNKLLFFKVGDWEKLPQANYVAITKVKFAKTVPTPKLMGSQSCTTDFSSFKCCVFICEDKRIKQLIFKGEYEDALIQANLIKDYLDVEIIDYVKA